MPSGTYLLTIPSSAALAGIVDGDLDITDDLSISGAGPGLTVIDAGSIGDRVVRITPGSAGTVQASIAGVTIQGGTAASSGAGVLNVGQHLQIVESVIRDNFAGGSGGGILNSGVLQLQGVDVLDNVAQAGGGGIDNRGGSVEMEGGSLRGNTGSNRGGGLYNGVSPSGTPGIADLRDVLIEANEAMISGGGVATVNGSQTTLHQVSVRGNESAVGGGLHLGSFAAVSTMIVSNSRIVENHATSGGGIANEGGVLTVQTTSLTANTAGIGGGLWNSGQTSYLYGQINENTATYGAGIENVGQGVQASVSLVETVLAHNRADLDGGGARNWAVLAITDSTLEANDANRGAGVYNEESGELALDGSTFFNNDAATAGGGLYNTAGTPGGRFTVVNSTFHRNLANDGAGIYSVSGAAPQTVSSATIASNWDEGIASYGSGVVLINTIVANNGGSNCDGTIISLGHNLASDASCSLTAGGDLPSTAAGLDGLAWNGGPTQTRALLPGSAAIDGGDNAACPARDQRGVTRFGSICDIGAYEANSITITIGPAGPLLFDPSLWDEGKEDGGAR